ncbi:N-terminal glutamine amidase-domain-containing protein [Lentinula raphanica]|nr:N-terminal glutamine amidase-domain-containing protein [Lentinula raphanica]KAJ3824401.1 N-terminal glutamine amidase-domain-containing protein [Lentinula raphanica]KAJ3977185.1 N-terminal glutamine amidase-domain-containing protein [Lentinula raphanica]
MSLLPPELPKDAVYTPYWCEENVYLLVQSFSQNPLLSETWDVFVVFISNHNRTVALWNQKLSKEPYGAVVWDYHVVVVLRPQVYTSNLRSWVYDFDTRLGLPVTWDSYFAQTFSTNVPDELQSSFRVVSANIYLNQFASDRSHMLANISASETPVPSPSYIQPVPPYPPIRGPQCMSHNNLMEFVSMIENIDGYGDVFNVHEIPTFFLGPKDPELCRSKETSIKT